MEDHVCMFCFIKTKTDNKKVRFSLLGKWINRVLNQLKPFDTFGKQYCPSPTLRVSHKITNL